MSHHGLLNSEFTFTPLVRQPSGLVKDITIACSMYSSPLVETFESVTVDGQTGNYGVTVTDYDNRVLLGTDSFNWSVPEVHWSEMHPLLYKIDWKWIADETQEKQMNLIKASTEFKNMMRALEALQETYDE